MDNRITIYLASLANTRFGTSPATIPLEIGFIKTYAVSQFHEGVDIQLFRTFEELYRAIKTRRPHVLGCSWYGWNRYLTTNALAYIKHNFPEIITVVGGANVPEGEQDIMRDLKEFPCIDFMIPGEGEISFSNLLRAFMDGGNDALYHSNPEGVYYLSRKNTAELKGSIAPLAKDINIFPSPYLSGHLDKFLDTDLMPIVQTARGCPFHCAFCVSAKTSWDKMRSFDTERVKNEVEYLAARAKNRTLRFTDENFGILPRDLEIARIIADMRKNSGYPSGLRVYTHKDINQRIKEMTLLLSDLIPMNISYQTLTEPVLNNINRKNITIEKLRSSIDWAHRNNINVTTETIFGLPGETYDTFMDVINKFVELRMDSVVIGTLMMLKETQLDQPANIEKYGYKILYSIAEHGYTKADDFESVEIDAWAVESNAFSFDDFMRIKLFTMVYHLFMFWGYFKEMVYMLENRGVKIRDVISELIENPGRYPFFAERTKKLGLCLRENLFATKKEVEDVFKKRFSASSATQEAPDFISPFNLSKILKGEMIHTDNQNFMIDEVSNAAFRVFERQGAVDKSEFMQEMGFMKTLVKNVIIPFWEVPKETVSLLSPYDLPAWYSENYSRQLSAYALKEPAVYKFGIRSAKQYHDFVKNYSDLSFHLQSELFFRTFRTNNIRRFLITDKGEGDAA